MILAIKAADMNASLVLLPSAIARNEGTRQSQPIDRTDWESGRQLSDDLLKKIEELLIRNNADWAKLQGLIVFKGPGSFTSLRIGITVMNTIADAQQIPIVGVVGEEWIKNGQDRLAKGENDQLVMPEYGGHVNITKPKR